MPILIVGSGRTASSLMLNAVRAASGLPGHGEDHFLPIFRQLSVTSRKFFNQQKGRSLPGTLLHDVNPERFLANLRQFARDYVSGIYGSDEWVAKSPGLNSLRALPEILRIWPDAKVIYTKRRPIENILSRLKKFPTRSFEFHCVNLAETMTLWHSMRSNMNHIEVDQYEVVTDPHGVTGRISTFIAIDKKKFLKAITKTFPQKLSVSYAPMSFETIEWGTKEKALFLKYLDTVMHENLYSYEEDYWNQTKVSVDAQQGL